MTICAPDRSGLLSTCAGVLALNQLDVRAARIAVEDGYATAVFAVRPRFGRAPVPEILADGVRAALDGTLPLAERLRQREADYRQDGAQYAAPRIAWHNGEVSGAATGIVEVRAGDGTACCTASPRPSPARGSTSPRPGSRPWGPTPSTPSTSPNPSGTPVDAEQRRRVDDALVAATRGHVRPAGRRHARLNYGELSYVRATVGT